MSSRPLRRLVPRLAAILLSVAAAQMGCSLGTGDESSMEPDIGPVRVVPARIFGSTPAPLPDRGVPSSLGAEPIGVAQQALNSGHGIAYNGGRVMSGPINVYYIWYGNWAGNNATTILTDFASTIGGTPRFNINTLYDDAFGGQVSGIVNYASSTTTTYTYGTNLSLYQVYAVVTNAIAGGQLPEDNNGVYFVLTSSDVTVTNPDGTTFCNQFCGWHTYGYYNTGTIKFSFVGNGDRCPSSCSPYPGPNGNTGADGMASVILHELEETATDPQLDAWFDPGYQENSDKCAWQFGTTYTAPNGAPANAHIGARDYLVQQNWVNSGAGYCASSWVGGGAQNGASCTSASQCTSGFCIDGVCCNSVCGGGSTSDCQACSVAAGAAQDGTCSTISGCGTSPNGASCTSASQCGSGFCVDGVCCNSACSGSTTDCQACSVAAGGAQNGTCGAIVDNTNNCNQTCVTVQRGTGTVADAHIVDGSPTKAYGTNAVLSSGLVGSTLRYALMRFDLSFISPSATVASATLNMDVFAGGNAVSRVHRITAPWSESTVTWGSFNNAFSSTIESSAYATSSAYSVDVKPLVQSWVNGTLSNNGLLLERDPTGQTNFYASEFATASLRPRLTVCYY